MQLSYRFAQLNFGTQLLRQNARVLLNIKPEMHYIAVFKDIVFAF